MAYNTKIYSLLQLQQHERGEKKQKTGTKCGDDCWAEISFLQMEVALNYSNMLLGIFD
jgi:hypothetical protein